MLPHTTQAPAVELTTKADMLALRQVYNRVVSIAKDNPQAYEPLSAETYPEVATSEAIITSMVLHVRRQQGLLRSRRRRRMKMVLPFMRRYGQKTKEDEEQRQRKEEAQARTNKLLAELRAAREKVRMCGVCACEFAYVYM